MPTANYKKHWVVLCGYNIVTGGRRYLVDGLYKTEKQANKRAAKIHGPPTIVVRRKGLEAMLMLLNGS